MVATEDNLTLNQLILYTLGQVLLASTSVSDFMNV